MASETTTILPKVPDATQTTSWINLVGTVLYYLTLPLTKILGLLLRLLGFIVAILLYPARVILATTLLPLQWLAKFETILIYLGVAASVGLITGLILHTSSSLLVSVFNLTPGAEPDKSKSDKGRTAASVRAAREQRTLEDAWQSSSRKPTSAKGTGSDSLEEKYAAWLTSDAGKRKKSRGVLGQTILEEDDDSE